MKCSEMQKPWFVVRGEAPWAYQGGGWDESPKIPPSACPASMVACQKSLNPPWAPLTSTAFGTAGVRPKHRGAYHHHHHHQKCLDICSEMLRHALSLRGILRNAQTHAQKCSAYQQQQLRYAQTHVQKCSEMLRRLLRNAQKGFEPRRTLINHWKCFCIIA